MEILELSRQHTLRPAILAQGVPTAKPRGIAIGSHLADHVHTDIVGHSTDGRPTHNDEEFLVFLRSDAESGSSAGSPST
jgi:catalase